jgi:beta-ketoacyl-acyl-carrier-protein synthase II
MQEILKRRTSQRRRRVVITGMGVVSPIGIGVDVFWRNALSGRSGVVAVDRVPAQWFRSKIAGQVDDFEPRDHGLREGQLRRLDRFVLFALACTEMALSHAKLTTFDKQRAGVSIANAIGGTRRMEQEFLTLTERGRAELDPTWAHKALYQWCTFNTASAEVAAVHGLQGPCITLPTGCTAGLDALGFSLDMIRSGEADVMITGAAEAPLCPIAMAAFDVIGALSSKRNDAPATASRPYDVDRDGFVLGEGAAVFVLEELEHARKRGASVLAELCGYGSTSNAFHMTDLPPGGEQLAASLTLALQDARIEPEQVDYISAHGSSTSQNDINETAAYKRVFGKRAYSVPMSSLKSLVGHALSAANAIETVAAVMTLQDGQIHPTINHDMRDPACDLDCVPNHAIHRDVDVILKNASGFSGIHSALVLARPELEGRLS